MVETVEEALAPLVQHPTPSSPENPLHVITSDHARVTGTSPITSLSPLMSEDAPRKKNTNHPFPALIGSMEQLRPALHLQAERQLAFDKSCQQVIVCTSSCLTSESRSIPYELHFTPLRTDQVVTIALRIGIILHNGVPACLRRAWRKGIEHDWTSIQRVCSPDGCNLQSWRSVYKWSVSDLFFSVSQILSTNFALHLLCLRSGRGETSAPLRRRDSFMM